MSDEDWRRVFMSVPALVAVKGVLTDGVWTLFWRYKGGMENELYKRVYR